MHIEFLSLTKALNVPLLSEDDITALHRLQKQWEHWANRERQHAASRVAEEQHAAFVAFIENPTTETEQKLLVTADAELTGTRYATLRRATDRVLILDGAYYTNLLGDDVVAKGFVPQVAQPGIMDAMIRRLAGFDLHETVILPENGEKLIGFAAHPRVLTRKAGIACG